MAQSQPESIPFRYRKDHASMVCASLGLVLHLMAYLSFDSTIVALLVFLVCMLVLRLTPLGGKAEWRMFRRMYAVCFMMAGLAAVYLEVNNDFFQLFSDANGFYTLVVDGATKRLSLLRVTLITDGALMLYVWTPVYDFFKNWGMATGRYPLTTVNTVFVAFSAVLAIKMARLVFGEDSYRFNRLIQLVSLSGILWMFAAITMRDCALLLSICLLAHAFLRFVVQPSFGLRLWYLVMVSFLVIAALEYLRNEMMFVPIPMLLAAVFALRSSVQSKRLRRVATLFTVLGTLGGLLALALVGQQIQNSLNKTEESYEDAAEARAAVTGGSLGLELIVQQPAPIRFFVGTAYAYLQPIPFWAGFQQGSAYHFFKSSFVLLNYVLLPLMSTALWFLYKDKLMRTPALMWLAATAVGFSVSVGLTSIEARHLGVFMMLPLLLATVPDLRIPKVRRLFRALLRLMLFGMGMIHLFWLILKLV